MEATDHDILIEVHTEMKGMRCDISAIKDDLAKNYVTQKEFWPVRAISFSIIGLSGLGVLGAILALVIPTTVK